MSMVLEARLDIVRVQEQVTRRASDLGSPLNGSLCEIAQHTCINICKARGAYLQQTSNLTRLLV